MTRQHLLQSIATNIGDYRQGEIPAPNPEHVDRWTRQFDADVQDQILLEMDHVLRRSYLSRQYVLKFLRDVAALNRLTGGHGFWQTLHAVLARLIGKATRRNARIENSAAHWRGVQFLQIQKHGRSQVEMLCLLQNVLAQEYGEQRHSRSEPTGPFVYLDDILFTGNRLIADLRHWIRTEAPPEADLVVIVIGVYRRGFFYTNKTILQTASEAGKLIRLHWVRALEWEDRRWAASSRDAFHPTALPDHPLVRAYVHGLAEAGFVPKLRVAGAGLPSRMFSSESGRQLLEQQFLVAGLKIRSFYRNPQEILRPLGYHVLKDLGFGATVVTYRNCPNNCPLAWWWDTAAISARSRGCWHPLFPRKV